MWARYISSIILGLVLLSATPASAALQPSRRHDGGRSYSKVFTWAPDQAWAADVHDLIVTRDGGQTWTLHLSAFRPEQALENMGFEGALNGQVWWAGSPGLRVTTNGGQTWTTWPEEILAADGQIATHLEDITLVSPSEAWGLEVYPPFHDPEGSRALRFTRDAGRTWGRVAGPQPQQGLRDIHSFYALSARLVWVMLIPGDLYRTLDGGQTWSYRGLLKKPVGHYFLDAETGWALESRYPYPSRIYRTTDGGQTWALAALPPLPRETLIRRLFFLTATLGWAVGDSGTILHTTDGGQTWQLLPSGTQKYLTAIHFSDPQHGWAVGTQNTILKTTDGGQTWTKVDDDMKNWRP